MWSAQTIELVKAACQEDLGAHGDITSALLGRTSESAGRLVLRQGGVICGMELAPLICQTFSDRLGQPLEFRPLAVEGRAYRDGDIVAADTCVATVHGAHAALLTVERTLLNFLGRMSGVATLTRRFVDAARQVDPRVKILDTRKTLPGWRQLDKYAVRAGGGHNHRFGLYDAILIKDNHLAGVPSSDLPTVLDEWLRCCPTQPAFVEVEVDSLSQFYEVCQVASVDIVLLDNFSLADMRAAVAHRDSLNRSRLELEASGCVGLDDVREIAATGIDRISVGALTHSAPVLDLALDV
ncbi:MAG: carboxylating nicotinate-nucleotide diphosphorylase [Planctomycetota bacterium]